MTTSPLPDGWTMDDFVGSDFDNHLRILIANAMRVSRGSGRAHDIPRQLEDCVVALKNYREKRGMGPSSGEITEALYVLHIHDREAGARPNPDLELLLSGALQIGASRIARQHHQESLGLATVKTAVREGDVFPKPPPL